MKPVKEPNVRLGSGVEFARQFAPEHAAVVRDMLEQLLIVFLKRLGGKITIPVAEVDATGGDLFAFKIDGNNFHFQIEKKQ